MQRVDIHIFALDSDSRLPVEHALADRRLTKIRPVYFDGSLATAVEKYKDEPSPGLLIVETRDAAPTIFAQLEGLSEVCRTETNLILLGPHNDVALYRQLAKRGVHEYIPTPADPGHLIDAVLAVCADPDATQQGRLISFIGGSGGAGSTTLANNVAWQIAKIHDGEVTLIDLDLAFGTVGLDFNLESPQSAAQALAQADRLDAQMLEHFLAKYNDNLRLLTSPGDCDANADVDAGAVDQLLRAARRNAGWVVVNLPRCWAGWVRHVVDASDDVVMTAVPTLASLRNAKSAADAIAGRRAASPRLHVVLNRIGANPKTDIPAKDFANTLGIQPAALVPNDPAVFAQAANAGQMVGESSKGQRVLDPVVKLAVLVSGRPLPEKRRELGALQKFMSWSMKPRLGAPA
jgi:pilus assembly protein CpaE